MKLRSLLKIVRVRKGCGRGSLTASPISRSLLSPCAFNAEGAEAGGFGVFKVALYDAVDAAAARAAVKAGAQFGQVFGGAKCDHFDLAVFGVPDPAAQIELTGFAMHIPAKTDALHTTLDEKM